MSSTTQSSKANTLTLGILGGGQLGRMLAIAARSLGCDVEAFDPSSEACAQAIAPTTHAAFTDAEALAAFAARVDVATVEFENIPTRTIELVAQHTSVPSGSESLRVAQDRLLEKQLFESVGIDVHPYTTALGADAIKEAIATIGMPAMIKARGGGYDGKGQLVVRTEADLERATTRFATVPVLVEAFVAFDRELSIVGVRGIDGHTAFYPIVENVHANGILTRSVAPASVVDIETQSAIERAASAIMNELGHVGVLALELFDAGGTLFANEMAPRVHNTGHWTLGGSVTSQFENHVRAVMGLPLGSTAMLTPHAAMVNLIGPPPSSRDVLAVDRASLHLYGKEPLPGRKIGHVTITASSEADLLERVSRVESLGCVR